VSVRPSVCHNDDNDDDDTCEVFVFSFERLDDVVAVVDLASLAVDLGRVVTTIPLSQLQLRLQRTCSRASMMDRGQTDRVNITGNPDLKPTDVVRHNELAKGRHTIRYDTTCYFNLQSKAEINHLNLPHGTNN